MEKQIKKKKKLSDKRKLHDFLLSSVDGLRTAAPCCRHFGDCGGCEFQDVPYRTQLDAKKRAFGFIAGEVAKGFREKAVECAESAEGEVERQIAYADSLENALAGFSVAVVASPREFGYRQRMDYVYAFGKAGLRRANRHRQVIELEECPLLGDDGFAVMLRARRLADAAGLESYDYMRHTGELRYFVVRRSRNGEILLSMVTKTRNCEAEVRDILATLVREGVVTSGHWLLAEGLGDVSFGTPLAHYGAPWIVETMNGYNLRIGPNTFFQSNPAVAEMAYRAIADFIPASGRVLDMYSGVGSIAVCLSRAAAMVTAVENVPDNIELAEVNIRENQAANVRLHLDDSSAYLAGLTEAAITERPDLVVVNPPRPGVEGGGMAAIKKMAPFRLAYLSCNPFTLLRNLAEVVDDYAIKALTIYDMFPQTRHF